VQKNTYQISIEGFEGPFGLLLELINKRKLFINDVSLSTVTEDYLTYMKELGDESSMSHREITSFVLVASTLILIKSKSLLPDLSLTQEEEGDIASLEERLRLYEIFTKLSSRVGKKFGQQIIFPALEKKRDVLVFLPDEQITKESMMIFAEGVLSAMPSKVFLPQTEVKKVISIEEMLDKLALRIQNTLQMSFKEFAGHGKGSKEDKVVMIVGFLAMLELVKQGIINAVQDNDSSDIMLHKVESNHELSIND